MADPVALLVIAGTGQRVDPHGDGETCVVCCDLDVGSGPGGSCLSDQIPQCGQVRMKYGPLSV
ncbi:MAG: hypothetical protein J2P22_18415 [Nocardioides sp.]|nr:hypothetical protein [Nocardioides sp.]